MNEEVETKFFANIDWIKNHIDADYIYQFAEESLILSVFLIAQLDVWMDLKQEMEDETKLGKAVKRIVGLRAAQEDIQ